MQEVEELEINEIRMIQCTGDFTIEQLHIICEMAIKKKRQDERIKKLMED
jgi:hypothetical protein